MKLKDISNNSLKTKFMEREVDGMLVKKDQNQILVLVLFVISNLIQHLLMNLRNTLDLLFSQVMKVLMPLEFFQVIFQSIQRKDTKLLQILKKKVARSSTNQLLKLSQLEE